MRIRSSLEGRSFGALRPFGIKNKSCLNEAEWTRRIRNELLLLWAWLQFCCARPAPFCALCHFGGARTLLKRMDANELHCERGRTSEAEIEPNGAISSQCCTQGSIQLVRLESHYIHFYQPNKVKLISLALGHAVRAQTGYSHNAFSLTTHFTQGSLKT